MRERKAQGIPTCASMYSMSAMIIKTIKDIEKEILDVW